jgi:hypothetical protein
VASNAIGRVVTIATAGFRPQLERLVVSLERTNPQLTVTVFCDDLEAFGDLASERCTPVGLPEIERLGVKRSKFAAYRRAAAEGGFIFLDADVVVLESLEPLRWLERLAACPDDLSACWGIPDRTHPWPGDPALAARRYVNAGVLVVPAAARDFVELAARRVADDAFWERYIYPGALYDNHVLCALLNLHAVAIQLVEAAEYNWQGLQVAGALQVRRAGEHLVNIHTGRRLRLVHFAGIQDVDAYLASLPLEIASLIHMRSVRALPAHIFQAAQAFEAALGVHTGAAGIDQTDLVACGVLHREATAIAARLERAEPPAASGHVTDPTALLWVTYAVPERAMLWNGLRCGGAYLDGDEYNYLVELIERQKVRSVVSTGAGETTVLFHRLGLSGISIELAPGPWLERARVSGGACALVPFDDETLQFDDAQLRAALGTVGREIDLLFVDSPPGGRRRSRVVDQFLRMVSPAMILFHDAHRDVENVYSDAARIGLEPIEYCRSVRGMVLLSAQRFRSRLVHDPRIVHPGFPLVSVGTRLSLIDAPAMARAGEPFTAVVEISNRGAERLTSHSTLPVNISYHWYDADGTCAVLDGVRTALPFDILPGGSARFPLTILAPVREGRYELLLSPVQERVFWFHALDAANALRVPVDVAER